MPGFRRLRQGRGEEAEAESGRVGADGAAAGAEEGHGQVQAHLRGIHDEALQGGPHGDGKAANLTLNKLKFGPNYVIYCITYRVSHPIVCEISPCFVLELPLPCLGSS